MGRSVEKEGFFGEKYTQHYNEYGKKAGHSEVKTDSFGNKYVEHYDQYGKVTGRSEEKTDSFGNKYIEHYDQYGKVTGRSEEKTDSFENKYVEHYDQYGKVIGRSEGKIDFFGNKYTEHIMRNSPNHGGDHIADPPVTVGDVGGVFVFAIILFILAALAYAFQAWRAFAGKNETILKLSLEYIVPLVAMIVIAICIAAKDKRLKSTGLLEGAIVGLVMGGTSFFGLEMSLNLGDKLIEPIEKIAEGNFLLNILVMVFPFFMFCLIFILYPVMGWLFRLVVSKLNDNGLKQTMNDTNRKMIKPICWITTVLFVALFITVNLQDKSSGFVFMDMLFNLAFAALVTFLYVKLSTRIACGKQ